MKKEDTTSPTSATESVFITSTIDEFERKIVATMEVTSDFLHNPMGPKDPKVHMVL